MSELQGQVAVISGGLGDIGRACAIELARRGADIAVGDCDDAGRAEPLRVEMTRLGRRFHFAVVDVSDAAAVSRWIDSVEKELGPPTIAIPGAAIVEMASMEQLIPAVWQRHLDVNLTGAFNVAHTVAQRLVELKRPGRIVFIGSWAGHTAHAHIPAYCVAKAGLRMVCKCMALEYARHGILVNEVAPGVVNAGLSRSLFDKDPALTQRTVAGIPIGELMQPEEVALHVAHLCDPRNRNATGSVLLCDGGLSLVTATARQE
ncbi:MAG: SDR family oxidoreductase [Planctomycetes bacterium]|nr:SDR family oxidoreductase [Planctomycetota bacterium]